MDSILIIFMKIIKICLDSESHIKVYQDSNNRKKKEDHEYYDSFCQRSFGTAGGANRLSPTLDPGFKSFWRHFRTMKEIPTFLTIIFSNLSKLQLDNFRVFTPLQWFDVGWHTKLTKTLNNVLHLLS